MESIDENLVNRWIVEYRWILSLNRLSLNKSMKIEFIAKIESIDWVDLWKLSRLMKMESIDENGVDHLKYKI